MAADRRGEHLVDGRDAGVRCRSERRRRGGSKSVVPNLKIVAVDPAIDVGIPIAPRRPAGDALPALPGEEIGAVDEAAVIEVSGHDLRRPKKLDAYQLGVGVVAVEPRSPFQHVQAPSGPSAMSIGRASGMSAANGLILRMLPLASSFTSLIQLRDHS